MHGFEQLDTVVETHPAAVDAYRRAVANPQDDWSRDDKERRGAMEIIRSLVTRIDVLPQQARGQVEPNVRGALAELLNLPNRQPSELPSAGMVVAEERYRLSAKYTLLPSFLRLR